MRIVFAIAAAAVLLCGPFAFAEDGPALYQKNCSGCHGPDGKAQTPAAKAMKVPALAGLNLTADQVIEKLKSIDKHKSIVAKLSDAELNAIANAVPK